MDPRPFDPPLPSLETAHDVRRLRACSFCGRLGKNLPAIACETFRRRPRPSRWAHAFCLVEAEGWPALAALPEVELGKVALSDFLAWGLTVDEFDEKLAVARK